MSIKNILNKDNFSKDDIVNLLKLNENDSNELYDFAYQTKKKYVGNFTYLRALIEYSNICSKNCLYCGIRYGNKNVTRYTMSDEEILESVSYAMDNQYSSIVIQGGEIESKKHTEHINDLIKKIMDLSEGKIGITLSLGEQSYDTYRLWRQSGAKRYLLRIESSNEELFYKIHNKNENHNFQKRVECLKMLKDSDYQVGTGIMIGLPEQTLDHLADDVFFMIDLDIDMIGMGPYIEHIDTPLFEKREMLLPLNERFNLSLKLISIMRIFMKDINIAASTAMQTIDSEGKEKALKSGANILMPNITPLQYKENYKLYENKPKFDELSNEFMENIKKWVSNAGDIIKFDKHGDSIHYKNKQFKVK